MVVPVALAWGPQAGPMGGGTSVTVMGTDLDSVILGYIGSSAYPLGIVSKSATQLVMVTPGYPAPPETNTVNGTISLQYSRTVSDRITLVPNWLWTRALPDAPPIPPPPPCVRRAWLVVGAKTIPLEDPAAGYVCTELDLGYPEVRDSATVNNRPGQDGVDDRTAYMGGRPITAAIRATAGGTMTLDEIAALLASVQLPSLRPVFHYVLDRPGTPERATTVRASGFGWPLSGSRSRDIHLSWLASDPIFRDPVQRVAVAMAGSSTAAGRTYPLTFNRIYPVGGGVATNGEIRSAGDVPVRPVFRIWGPITNPYVGIQAVATPPLPAPNSWIYFNVGFTVPANQYVDVDTAARTAFMNSDPGQSVMAQLDWSRTVWPVLPLLPAYSWFFLRGDSTGAVTQAQALWYDGFLT